MVYRWILTHWLQQAVKQKVQETVFDAAREHVAAQATAQEPPLPCSAAVVFALREESGGLEDLLRQPITTQGDGFVLLRGLLESPRSSGSKDEVPPAGGTGEAVERRVVTVVRSGAGRKAAAAATDALIAGHRPKWVISAGFCGGLTPQLRRHDLFVADQVVDSAGQTIALPPTVTIASSGTTTLSLTVLCPGAHVGRLLTVDQVVREPEEKQALGEKFQALAVDMESLAVAEVCRRWHVPCLVVRVVSDAYDERLPKEVAKVLAQKSRAAQWGAALGAILDRPGSLNKMYRLHENAIVASDRLAKCLVSVLERLSPAT